MSELDQYAEVETGEAFDLVRLLARLEGLFAGTSTGAALSGAIAVAREAAAGNRRAAIVAVAPDGGGKYLSTALWEP